MNKYVITFSKEGYIKFISHLDMLRLFKRAFKKTGIKLKFSQGFNPHPKIGFAQPLSLGYTSICELLEIETLENLEPSEIVEKLSKIMPDGIELTECERIKDNMKPIAALIDSAEYIITFPMETNKEYYRKRISDYLSQESIFAEKRQKKTKKIVSVDIRNKIRSIHIADENKLTLILKADCGSDSNLSPEQVISSFTEFCNLDVKRYEIEVCRTKLNLEDN